MAKAPANAPEAKIDTAKAKQAMLAAKLNAPKPAKPSVAITPAMPVAAPLAMKPAAPVTKAVPLAASAPVPAAALVAPAAVPPVIAPQAIATQPAALPAAPIDHKPTLKDTIMNTTETITTKLGDTVSGAQDRLKSAFEKTSAFASGYGEFAKGNMAAVVESGKILAAGMQDMGKAYVAEGKSAIETMTADVKEIAAVKSPSDFFKLQGEMMRRNVDAAMATTSKHSEAMVKLAGDAFAPISTRVSLAVEKVKQAA